MTRLTRPFAPRSTRAMNNNSDDPVSEWLAKLRDGDSEAQHHIYEKYARRIERVATRILDTLPLKEVASEDVAIKVLKSLFLRIEDGRLEAPQNRQHLWGLLRSMAKNKSHEVRRHELADKRSYKRVELVPQNDAEDRAQNGIERVADKAAKALDETEKFADCLETLNDELRQVALYRMAGYSNDEIAQFMNCGKRTVERRIHKLRSKLAMTSDP